MLLVCAVVVDVMCVVSVRLLLCACVLVAFVVSVVDEMWFCVCAVHVVCCGYICEFVVSCKCVVACVNLAVTTVGTWVGDGWLASQ